MKTMDAVETNELKQLVSQLCRRMGLQEAHDWTGVETTKDIFLYLNAILENLPPKGIEVKYRVHTLKGIYLEHDDFKTNLAILIEKELEEPNKSSDLAALKDIRAAIVNCTHSVDDTEEDIKLRLYEYRARVMEVVIKNISGLSKIQTEGNKIMIFTTDNWEDEELRKLQEDIAKELDGINMDFVMTDPKSHIEADHMVFWHWV